MQNYRARAADLLDENKKIKPAKRAVYDDLSSILGMTPAAINVAVKKHAKEIFGDDFDNSKSDNQSGSLVKSQSENLLDEFESMEFEDMAGSVISINVDSKYAEGLQTVESQSKNLTVFIMH